MEIKKKRKTTDKSKMVWLKHLGLRIKFYRQQRLMSQAELAYNIDMDAQNISRIERGLVNTSAYAVKEICITLGVSISEFYQSMEKKGMQNEI